MYWGYVLLAFASLLLLGFSDNARGPVLADLLRDLGLSDEQGGLMFSASSLGMVVGSLLCARAIARWGALRCLQGGLLLIAGGLALSGVAWSLATLLAGATLFGFGAAFLAVTQNLMVEQGVVPNRRRQGLSALHAVYGLASLLAPLAVTGFYDRGLTWRSCLVAIAFLPIVLAGATILVERTPPLPALGSRTTMSAKQRVAALAIALVCGSYVTSELLISTRLPLLLEREGHSQAEAAFALTGFFACLLLGRVLFSVVRWPLSNRSTLLLSAGFAWILYVLGLWFEPMLLVLVALPMAPFFPALVDLISEEFPGQVEAVLGMMFASVSALLIGAHWGVGLLSDVVGLRQALWAGPAVLLATLVLIALRPKGQQ